MKKIFKSMISVLIMLTIIATLPMAAFADTNVSNVISGTETPAQTTSTGISAREMLGYAENYSKLSKPSYSDYFSTPVDMYINAPKGHSVYAHRDWNSWDDNFGTPYHGSRVYAVAEHEDMYCVLYFTKDYEFMAGWVKAEHLTTSYPGMHYSNSKTDHSGSYYVGDMMMSWSRDNFIGKTVKYSVLDTTIYDCVGFTLDYQLVAFNGAEADNAYGDRDIYVNDGTGWIYIGSFELSEFKPCHIELSFEEPMTITAIAVIPDCADQINPLYRQSILDVICVGV